MQCSSYTVVMADLAALRCGMASNVFLSGEILKKFCVLFVSNESCKVYLEFQTSSTSSIPPDMQRNYYFAGPKFYSKAFLLKDIFTTLKISFYAVYTLKFWAEGTTLP